MTNIHNINSNHYAIVIGSANMDICGAASNSFKIKDSNPGIISMSAGGVARNIAENLALLECKCHLITAVGNDGFGISLVNKANAVGINTDKILKLENEKTSAYLNIVDNTGEMISAISDMAIVDHITPEYIELHNEIIQKASVIVLDTNIPEKTLSYIINRFKEVPIIVDAASTVKAMKIKKHLSGIHSLKCNKIEAEALSGIEDDLNAIINWFHQRGVVRVYITLGEEGAFYSENQTSAKITHQKQHCKVINVTGAGDAFTAGITYGLLKEWTIIKSIHFGMAAAVIALNHIDTINPEMSIKKINRIMEHEYDN